MKVNDKAGDLVALFCSRADNKLSLSLIGIKRNLMDICKSAFTIQKGFPVREKIF